MLAASAVQAAARRAGLDWANAEGLGQIVVTSASTANATSTTRASSAGRVNVDVLVWARGLTVGEVVQPQDLIWGKAALAPADAPNDPDAVIGQAARRPLRAGAAIGARDVSAPQVVRANEVVTLTYENGGVSLSLRGKALSGGGVGDAINVLNVTSKKTVQAVVSGPGQALVGPGAEDDDFHFLSECAVFERIEIAQNEGQMIGAAIANVALAIHRREVDAEIA